MEIALPRSSSDPGGGMMQKCPYCKIEYYGLHFCHKKPVGIPVTSETVKRIIDWWGKKFRGLPWSDKK
jgi:hypothetical protein